MSSDPPPDGRGASALESGASKASDKPVGSAVLPCQAWTLDVVVKSLVPFHPQGSVRVHASIVSGGSGFSSKYTVMDGEKSPAVRFSGSGSFTWALEGAADNWEAAGTVRQAVKPQGEPFTAEVPIRPAKSWVIFKIVNVVGDAPVPGIAIGLKLGENKKQLTSAKDKPTFFMDLQHATRAGAGLQMGRPSSVDVETMEHPDVAWEFVELVTE